MIIFLYGPDSYRRRQKLKEIIGKYQQKHLAFGCFDLGGKDAEEEFSRLKEFSSNVSIFDDVKLGILENAFGEFSKENQSAFAGFLKNNLKNKDLTLVVCAEKAPLKNLSFLLKKPALAQEFKNLEGEQLKFFIKKEAEKRGLKLESPSAVVFLAEVFGGDIWALINELDKLSLFDSKIFDASRLKELIAYYKPLESGEFFSQLGGISSGSVGRKIANLEFLLSRGEEPAKIFNILAASPRNNAETIGKFADCDVAVKSGKLDYEEALVDAILR